MIDAAQLAAAAPPGGVLPPADETTELAYLDLRTDCAEVTESKARAVAAAFGPSLYLRASLRLVVASGVLPPARVASWFASVAAQDQQGGTYQIATVRGENLLERLEELMLAGCDLGDVSKPPIASWAPAQASILRDAIATGASVVVSRFGGPKAVERAVESEALADPVSPPPTVPLELVFADGYELPIDGKSSTELAATIERIPDSIAARCSTSVTECEAFARITAKATDLDDLREFAQRVELAAPVGKLGKPLQEAITPRYRRETTSVPCELLEFGVDARPASDWTT